MGQEGSGAWNVEEAGAALQVPAFVWDGAATVAPRIIGRAVIDGAETRVLSFFALKGKAPIWFRLWVEPDGLVRRAEIRAHGQFVTHRYYEFGAPFTIEPPVGQDDTP
jgi:hypothetical protein